LSAPPSALRLERAFRWRFFKKLIHRGANVGPYVRLLGIEKTPAARDNLVGLERCE
jgi:hypothetical protein